MGLVEACGMARVTSPVTGASSVGKRLWSGVKRAFHALGLAQNFIFLAIFYFLLFGPMALVARLTGRDFLGLRHPDRESFWQKRPPEDLSLERAKRQS